jgi:F-box protein 18 (helicase)
LAQVYFSTVHRCKGLEYDVVQLVPDFVSREKIAKVAEEWQIAPPTAGEQARFLEEINLLYVAVTRAKHRVYFPDDSRPLYYFQRDQQQVCPFIGRAGTILRELPEVDDWSEAEDYRLTELFCGEALSGDIARVMNRTLASVQQRILDLELPDTYPHPFWESPEVVGAVGRKVEQK